MTRIIKALHIVLFLSVIFSTRSAFAVTNNTHPLVLNGTALTTTPATETPLVENAYVTVMFTDFWRSGLIVWQLTTTDPTTSPTSTKWLNNECSLDNPAPHTGQISFGVSAVTAGTDNKLQKLMSLLQVSQLTGMQVTIMGAAVTGNLSSECTYTNITNVYLRNTTY